MKLGSDLSCHARLSGARGRVINNSYSPPGSCRMFGGLQAALQDNSSSAAREASRDPCVSSSAFQPSPRHRELYNWNSLTLPNRSRGNKSQCKGYKYCPVSGDSLCVCNKLLIPYTEEALNWSDYDFWGCNWLTVVLSQISITSRPQLLVVASRWSENSVCGQLGYWALRAPNLLRKFAKTLIEVSEVSSKQGAWFGKLSHWKTDGREKRNKNGVISRVGSICSVAV